MNNQPTKFRGTGVAIVTPFTASYAIDFVAHEKMINHVIHGGMDYIVLLGTTGESPTVSMQEKKALVEFTIEKINNRIPLVVGIGGNNTSEVVLAIQHMPLKGVDGILSVSPYYNKPRQEGVYKHFKAVAESSPVPVILYTVPGRTGGNIASFTTIRLATDFQNIIGIKEASGNMNQIYQVLMQRPENFLVISGDDGLTLPMLAMGADGVISVVANGYPKEFAAMVKYGLDGDFEQARKIHFQLIDLINALFADGSPGGIKAVLELKQLCQNIVRLPLVPVNMETKELIQKLVTQIDS
ncbi:MAG: 4-hydroxy-tetrahydrodipicolinate synthase [Bacteroidales bacterium]|nr:4-hydroxy-tetrahydrodipicolinate synthase [Bacteroidota bacterium]MBL6950100.1 4-hydroxy-tetrahydrodipicolinate synthase [Bacteroidales bacterium]